MLVTGGGSGIGAGIVEAFAGQGCEVIFLDINGSDSADLVERVGAKFVQVDLRDIPATQRAIAQILDGGAVDVLVNNAANYDRHKIEDVTEEYWDDRLNVNLKHQFFCAQEN